MDNNITKKTRKVGSKKQDSVLEVGIDAGFGNVKIYTKHNGEEIKITKKLEYCYGRHYMKFI